MLEEIQKKLESWRSKLEQVRQGDEFDSPHVYCNCNFEEEVCDCQDVQDQRREYKKTVEELEHEMYLLSLDLLTALK